jgi:hypothetical protein
MVCIGSGTGNGVEARRAQESWRPLLIAISIPRLSTLWLGLLLARRNLVRERMETQERGCIRKSLMLVCGCEMRVGSGMSSRSQQGDLPLFYPRARLTFSSAKCAPLFEDRYVGTTVSTARQEY